MSACRKTFRIAGKTTQNAHVMTSQTCLALPPDTGNYQQKQARNASFSDLSALDRERRIHPENSAHWQLH